MKRVKKCRYCKTPNVPTVHLRWCAKNPSAQQNKSVAATVVKEHWTANSSDELSFFINGEAMLYTERGFVEGTKQEYEGIVLDTYLNVELRIFDQGTAVNADSVFNEIVRQMADPSDWASGVGEESKIERYLLAQRIIFRKSHYFVSLIVNSGLDEALEVLKKFANNVASKI